MAMYRPWWRIEDVWGGISCFVVIVEDLYHNAQDLPFSFSFLITVIACIAGVEHGHSSNDVGGMDCHSLYLS
jgi:hypothetical protein